MATLRVGIAEQREGFVAQKSYFPGAATCCRPEDTTPAPGPRLTYVCERSLAPARQLRSGHASGHIAAWAGPHGGGSHRGGGAGAVAASRPLRSPGCRRSTLRAERRVAVASPRARRRPLTPTADRPSRRSQPRGAQRSEPALRRPSAGRGSLGGSALCLAYPIASGRGRGPWPP